MGHGMVRPAVAGLQGDRRTAIRLGGEVVAGLLLAEGEHGQNAVAAGAIMPQVSQNLSQIFSKVSSVMGLANS